MIETGRIADGVIFMAQPPAAAEVAFTTDEETIQQFRFNGSWGMSPTRPDFFGIQIKLYRRSTRVRGRRIRSKLRRGLTNA